MFIHIKTTDNVINLVLESKEKIDNAGYIVFDSDSLTQEEIGELQVGKFHGVPPLPKLVSIKIAEFSLESFSKKLELIPEYKIQNIKDGFTGYDFTLEDNGVTIQAFIDEFYRLKGLIENALTQSEINAITPNWPTEVVVHNG